MVQRAEEKEFIADDKFGIRKYRREVEVGLCRRLLWFRLN